MLSTSSTLLHRLRNSPGNAAAWERFVDLYTPLLLAWTRRLGLSEHDSADLLQDMFACLVEQLPLFEYNPQKSFRAWLKTLLLNRWRNLLRGRQTQTGADLSDLPAPDAVAELEEQEYRAHLVSRALKLMQQEFPTTTWLACWETVVNGRDIDIVAAELKITVNSVYLARSRVLRRLREELQGFVD